jgi:excinuclease UvrABC ATPase subunit
MTKTRLAQKVKEIRKDIQSTQIPPRNLEEFAATVSRLPDAYKKLCDKQRISSNSKEFPCPTCLGSGEIRVPQGPYDMEEETCPICKGKGKILRETLKSSQEKQRQKAAEQKEKADRTISAYKSAVSKLSDLEAAALGRYSV